MNAGGESSHGPPPSLWPVGFAVGIVCILVGLIVSWPAVAVGAALTLVFGFLWIRDVSRGHATVPTPDAEAEGPPEPAPAIPAHKGPPAMPETSPAEAARYPRSKFLEGATLGLGAAIGAVVTIPAVGFAVVPAFVDQGNPDIDLGPIDNFPQGEWVITHFNLRPDGGRRHPTASPTSGTTASPTTSRASPSSPTAARTSAVRSSPAGSSSPTRRRTRRPPGGQEIQITPVVGLSSFTCPCHGGSYDSEGNRTAGPPVRGLDRWAYEIKNGNLVLVKQLQRQHRRGNGSERRDQQVPAHRPRAARRRLGADPLPLPAAHLMANNNKKSARRAQIEQAVVYPVEWLEERSGLIGGLRYFLFRKVPGDTNWFHTLGSATLTAFLVQLITGVILAMYYKPDPDKAYQSIRHITDDVTLGWLVRGMHKWGASCFIILMFFHMARVFLFGAYKYPRELNWIIGVLLLALGMFEGFTGYLLPWDQTSYWATVVGININGTAPFLGPFIASLLRGGAEIGPDTLSRFYSIHMLLLPGAIIGLITLHLYLVIRLGVSSPPWSKEEAGADRPEPESTARRGLTQPAPRKGIAR